MLSLPPGVTVIGGDFNAHLDSVKDSSKGHVEHAPPSDAKFRTWVNSLGLCDTWRTWNPTLTQYTHTSVAHGSHSRIGYLLMPATDIPLSSNAQILPRGISDHSPTQLTLDKKRSTHRPM